MSSFDKLILALLLGLGALLRFLKLGRPLGGGDEAGMLLHFGYVPLDHIVTHYFEASNHIFHTILTHLMVMAFGEDNEIALRFPVFAFGVAGLWMIYKTAYALFKSHDVARLSLLIAAISPIHVYYSQTARGYSLAMFFSAAMIYAAVKLMESQKPLSLGIVFTLCGFLSVYTLPTNVYFVAGLAVWMFAALLVPAWSREFGWDIAAKRKKNATFLTVFTIMGTMTFAAYLHLFDQMIEVARYDVAFAKKIYGDSQSPLSSVFFSIIPGILVLIFDKNLWILPLLLVGFFWGRVERNNYRWLPLCILLVPMSVPVFTGVSGYPRNYLYNLPLLAVFLAGGITRTGEFLKERLQPLYVMSGIAAVFTIISAQTLFGEYYPSLQAPDGKSYKESMLKNSGPFDLIMIEKPKNYLYARTVYKEYLRNILSRNKLSGIKAVVDDPANIEKYSLEKGGVEMPIFSGISSGGSLRVLDVTGGRSLVSISSEGGFPVLPDDYEADVRWHVVSGKGTASREADEKIFGKAAIKLEAAPDSDFVVSSFFPKTVEVARDSLAVLIWAGRNLSGNVVMDLPDVVFINPNMPGKPLHLSLGTVNYGSRVFLEGGKSGFSGHWLAISSMAKMPAGLYNLAVLLSAPAGNTVVYDGLRFFVIEPR